MGLNVIFDIGTPLETGSGIFVRDSGRMIEVSLNEWVRRHGNENPPLTDLHFGTGQREGIIEELVGRRNTLVFNITNNLSRMAQAAAVYSVLWGVADTGIESADRMILPLSHGLHRLRKNPDYYAQFNARNQWGTVEDFIPFVDEVLAVATKYPAATVTATA